MAKFKEITSIDPLNIALTATSKKFRVLWLIITLIALIALIVLTAIFILKYLSEPKAVVTLTKSNRQPFPAVTFCNMNPYKVSALAATPELAGLVYWYRDAQKRSGDNNDKKRQKREIQSLQSCNCKSQRNTSAYDPSISSSIFARFELGFAGRSTWSCGFFCCSLFAPAGKKSRLARMDNQALISFLLAKGIISESPVYLGMRGSPPGSYWCKRNWTEGGPVTIENRGTDSRIAFTNNLDNGNGLGYLCEFYNDPVSAPSSSTGLSSTAAAKVESNSASGQVPEGQTGVPAATAAVTGGSLYADFPRVPTEADQSEPSSSTGLSSTAAAKAESKSVSRQVPDGQSEGQSETSVTVGGSVSADFSRVPEEAKQSKPSSSTGLSSTAEATAKAESVSGQVPDGQTEGLTESAATIGGSLFTDYSGVPDEADQCEPSCFTDLSVTAKSESETVSGQVPDGLTGVLAETAATIEASLHTDFPGVTTEADQSEAAKAESKSVSGQVMEGQTKNLTETVGTIRGSLVTDFPRVPAKEEQYVLAALKNASGSDLSLGTTSEDMLPYLLHSLPPNVGYALDDVVIRCVYDGDRCKKSDFHLHIDPSYGNCYTYNAFGKKAISNRPGAVGGLSAIYFVDQHEYLDFISSSGSRVIVHDHNSTVFPDVSGYSMPAGYANVLAMRLTQEACISTQANPCASYPSDVPDFNYVGKAYSTEGCLRSCFQKHIIDHCHCGDPRIPLPPNNTKVKHCPVTKRDCVNAFYDRDQMKDECNCPAACKRNIYEAITSKTRWSQFYDQPSDTNGTLFDRKKNQLAKIDIYFEDLTVIEYAEKIKYEMFELLLDFSSIAGLFLGMSVMSIFEIWHLILYIRKKCFQETSG